MTVSSSRNPHLRLSTEFDTEDSVFVNKAKLRLLGGKLKLKASGEVPLSLRYPKALESWSDRLSTAQSYAPAQHSKGSARCVLRTVAGT